MKNLNKYLVLISFFVILAMFTSTVSAANWTVNPGNSIQSIINNASDDDTITVNDDNGSAYTYTENVVINKKLALQAKTGKNVTIRPLNSSNPIITVNSGGSGSTIQGFNIDGLYSNSVGISLDSADNCIITENNLINCPEGIDLENSNDNTITGNNITNSDMYGICIVNSNNNEITGNTVNDNWAGIYIQNSNNNTIQDNTITSNHLYGIQFSGSDGNSVSGNAITGNVNNGISIYNSSVNVNFNKITGNGQYGLENEIGTVDATNNWWGSNNGPNTPNDINVINGAVNHSTWLILSIKNSGIIVTNDNYTSDITADLTYNNLNVDTSSNGNVPDGILINFITNIGTINSTISTISGTALSILNSSITAGLSNVTATLDNQTVSIIPKVFSSLQSAIDDTNTQNGDTIEIENGTYTENILLNKELALTAVNKGNATIRSLDPSNPIITVNSGGSGSIIQDLNIDGHHEDPCSNVVGIHLVSADNCTITGNNFMNCIAGIDIENSNNTTIHNNNMTTGQYYAICILNSNNNEITGNIVNDNWAGIYIGNSNNSTIEDNTITNNHLYGIKFSDSNNNSVSGNNIVNNIDDGISFYNSPASVNFNRITGNGQYGLKNEGNGTVDAINNWWGSNNDPNTPSDINVINGLVNHSTWLILNVTSSCDRSDRAGQTYNYTVTADLTHNNQGNDTSSDNNIPDDIPIYFNTTLGTINTSVPTRNGKASATLNNTAPGMANVSAALDNQTITTPTNITSVNTLGIYNTRTGAGFATIQAAIDDITTQNDDIITLADGTYTENIVVNKRLTIMPIAGENVTVQPVDSTNPTFTITSDGNGSKIQGLNITSGLYGISLDSANSCNITGNTISGNSYGIYVDNSNSTVISGNNVTNNYYGIYVDSSTGNNIAMNNLTNNFIGIYINTANNNTISGNNITYALSGICLSNSKVDNITLNNITNTGIGISYLNSTNITISGNNITNSSIQDMLLIDPTGIVMSSNIFNCGPAALATVMQNLGFNATQDELANYAGTDDTGTSMYGLIQAAHKKGLTAKGLKLSVNELEPGNIVYLTVNGEGHFSIFEGITGTIVYLKDPDLGNINMTMGNFTAAYLIDGLVGNALVVTNDSNNSQLNNNNTLTDNEMQNIKGTDWIQDFKEVFNTAVDGVNRVIETIRPYIEIDIEYESNKNGTKLDIKTKGHAAYRTSYKRYKKYHKRYHWRYKWVKIKTKSYHVAKYYPKKVTNYIKGQWWKGKYIGHYTVVYYGHTMTIYSHWTKMLTKVYY